jgi:hypothetical protein
MTVNIQKGSVFEEKTREFLGSFGSADKFAGRKNLKTAAVLFFAPRFAIFDVNIEVKVLCFEDLNGSDSDLIATFRNVLWTLMDSPCTRHD